MDFEGASVGDQPRLIVSFDPDHVHGTGNASGNREYDDSQYTISSEFRAIDAVPFTASQQEWSCNETNDIADTGHDQGRYRKKDESNRGS